MRSHHHRSSGSFVANDQRLSFQLYENHYDAGERCLLLLHGAGVAGVDTWEPMLPFIKGWRWVLVPDLRGMGDTLPLDGVERRFCVEEVAEDVLELLDYLEWHCCDVAGYSFGGLISLLMKGAQPHRFEKQFLLEAALLDRASQAEVVQLRERYSEAAQLLREGDNPERGIKLFLDTIAPNRLASPRSEALTIERLARRPLGFSYALDAVTEASRRIDRDALLQQQGDVTSLIGGRSVDAMHVYQQWLGQQLGAWCYQSVPGCDHSLPYQKQRQIGRIFSEELLRFLG